MFHVLSKFVFSWGFGAIGRRAELTFLMKKAGKKEAHLVYIYIRYMVHLQKTRFARGLCQAQDSPTRV